MKHILFDYGLNLNLTELKVSNEKMKNFPAVISNGLFDRINTLISNCASFVSILYQQLS